MSEAAGEDVSALDPSLRRLIEGLVEKSVADRLQPIQEQMATLRTRVESVESATLADRVSILVFSGEMDKLLAAFIVATGAAAMGTRVSMFFAFWGLAAIKKRRMFKGKPITEKMMAAMLPRSSRRLATSRMNMLGIGPVFFKRVMRKKNVQSLPEFVELARELGVRLVACRLSMEVMGIREAELLEAVEYGNVAVYLEDARDSRVTLFV